jgi:hypothetical protein
VNWLIIDYLIDLINWIINWNWNLIVIMEVMKIFVLNLYCYVIIYYFNFNWYFNFNFDSNEELYPMVEMLMLIKMELFYYQFKQTQQILAFLMHQDLHSGFYCYLFISNIPFQYSNQNLTFQIQAINSWKANNHARLH